MQSDRHPGKLRRKSTHGFTLIEVMIVMVIVAILATGVVFMFANPSARVKGEAFNMLAALNLARSEAVTENTEAWVEFLPGATPGDPDGYRIWLTGDTNVTYDAGTDTLIQETSFPVEVQFYWKNATDGPNVKPEGGGLDVEDGAAGDDDGVVFDSGSANDNVFAFTSMGTAINSDGDDLGSFGYIYIYYPVSASEPDKMRAAPYAIVVSASTGSIKIRRWTDAGAWSTK